MRNLSGQKILPGEESSIVANQTAASGHKRACRKTRTGNEKTKTAAREIHKALARHVDFAAAKRKLEEERRDLQHDLPIHESPHYSPDFSPGETEDRQSFSALVLEAPTRSDSDSLPASSRN